MMAANMQEQQNIEDQTSNNYRIWKKNALYLYDIIITYQLQNWWSLTAQWLPNFDITQDRHIHRAILGTMADAAQSNYLLIAKVYMPCQKQQQGKQQFGEIKEQNSRIQIQTKIVHQGQINRARYCPQRYNLIATKTNTGSIFLFDYAKRPSRPTRKQCQPDLTLIGHTSQGYGISWNQHKNGHILSGGYDHKVLLWDVQSAKSLNTKLQPYMSIDLKDQVEDIEWHTFCQHLFSSVGTDQHHNLIDTRVGKIILNHHCHSASVYSIDWHPFNQYIFATSSQDKQIGIWDIRNLKRIRSLKGHDEQVLKVQWCPHSQSLIASGSSDKKIKIWDMSKTEGSQQIFIHAGHRSKITDFDWNLNQKLSIISTQQTNIVHVWQMNRSLY